MAMNSDIGWDKAREAYERHKLEQIPQCSPWEYGPSNRLAIFPGLLAGLRLDLEFSCSSYRHVKAITADLSGYERQLLWNSLDESLAAKVRRLKQQWNIPVSFGPSPHASARRKPLLKGAKVAAV